MKRFLLASAFLLLNVAVLSAEQKQCYVAVDSSGSYDQLTVTSISLTLLRQFVDSNVQSAPISGFSEKGCLYRINVTEQETGIKVFIFGPKISDYGKSQLRGEPGLEQAVLRGIFKSLDKQIDSICNKYGVVLKEECKEQAMTARGGGQMQPDNSSGYTVEQRYQKDDGQDDRRIPPDCRKKPGVQLPEKCRMFYEDNNKNRRIPPDCQKKPGVQLPEKCRMFYEDDQNRRIPRDCHKKSGVKLPGHCNKFYE